MPAVPCCCPVKLASLAPIVCHPPELLTAQDRRRGVIAAGLHSPYTTRHAAIGLSVTAKAGGAACSSGEENMPVDLVSA